VLAVALALAAAVGCSNSTIPCWYLDRDGVVTPPSTRVTAAAAKAVAKEAVADADAWIPHSLLLLLMESSLNNEMSVMMMINVIAWIKE